MPNFCQYMRYSCILLMICKYILRVRVADEKLYPPGDDKWLESCVYVITYPKGQFDPSNLAEYSYMFFVLY